MVGLTAVVATAAGISGWIFYLQWCEMHKSLVRDQRAWIVPTITIQPTTLDPKAPVGAHIHLANSGKTPARAIFTEVVIEQVNKNLSPTLSYPKPDIMSLVGILFPNDPGSDVDAGIGGPPKPLNQAAYDSLVRGDSYIAAYLTVRYIDAFGIHHWVTECQWHAWAKGDFQSRACVEYANTDKNN